MMAQIVQARRLEGKDDEYRLAGILPAEALAPLVGPTLTDVTVGVKLTIDRRSNQLLRAEFKGRVTPTDAEDVERVIVLSRFDEAIIIEAPR